jgi:phosphoribosylformylglycinamidine synthase
MRTTWTDEGGFARKVVAPVSLVVTAFATLSNVRGTLTPQLRGDGSVLVLVDLAAGKARLGGSILAQVLGGFGGAVPDLDDATRLAACMPPSPTSAPATWSRPITTGPTAACGRPCARWLLPGGSACPSRVARGPQRCGCRAVDVCGGARGCARSARGRPARCRGAPARTRAGRLRRGDRPDPQDPGVAVTRGDEVLLHKEIRELQQAWDEVSWRISALRDNPECADEEHASAGSPDDVGLRVALTFDPADDVAAPYVNLGARPKVAILREQGVNSHVETSFAFDRAGFDTFDVHMTDLQAGRADLRTSPRLRGVRWFLVWRHAGRRGGLGALGALQPRSHAQAFHDFFHRPTPSGWASATDARCSPRSPTSSPGPTRGRGSPATGVEQYEARLTLVEVLDSPSIFFSGMAGSRPRSPSRTARAAPTSRSAGTPRRAAGAAVRRCQLVRSRRHLPREPQRQPDGLTAVTTADGRFTAMMPHPERVQRNVQLSWTDGPVEQEPVAADVPQRTGLRRLVSRTTRTLREFTRF